MLPSLQDREQHMKLSYSATQILLKGSGLMQVRSTHYVVFSEFPLSESEVSAEICAHLAMASSCLRKLTRIKLPEEATVPISSGYIHDIYKVKITVDHI